MTALSFDDPPPARAQTFDDLYAAYADRVRAYARVRLGDTHLADDVVQETFLRVYRFQDRLDPSRPAWPWVKAIASTMCANAVRGRRNTAESVVGDLEADPEAAAWLESGLDHRGPEHHALLAENRRQLAGVLNGLADGHREVLLQKDLLGLTVGEIAARGGASPDSVKSLVVRARSAFRRSWDRAGHGRLAALAPWLRRGRADHVAGTLVLTGVVPSAQAFLRWAGPVLAAGLLSAAGSGSDPSHQTTAAVPGPASSTPAPAYTPMVDAAGAPAPRGAAALPPRHGEDATMPAPRSVAVAIAAPVSAGGAESGVRRDGEGRSGEVALDDHLVLEPGPVAPGTTGHMAIECDSAARQMLCDVAGGALPSLPSG